ncbi:alpha/beta fold hydrolase [Halovivax gelatinilyticus]|uniref:alpha/beta fold hydrolase n=1 Tax=Halovivax gelatinilyticus TaxID=2961597 RepID=UPI0020CA4080|nr:alpha/beta hydrolase [Halovivax gelatinilyticus]
MQTVTRDGTELAYDVDGPVDGEPVVFLSGLGYGRWMWRFQRDALADSHRTIRIDNRGAGDSDEPEGPYSIDEMAADVEAVLDAEGIARAHVVGASMGGMIAQRYAIEYDRAATLSLLCSSPGGPDAEPIPEETQEVLVSVPESADEREAIKHRMAVAVSPTFYEDDPDLVSRIVDWRLESDASEAARAAQAAAVMAFDASDELDRISIPTLVAHGTADRVLPVENGRLLAESIPNATFEPFDGAHHLFFIEEAEAVTDRLRTFLGAISPVDA